MCKWPRVTKCVQSKSLQSGEAVVVILLRSWLSISQGIAFGLAGDSDGDNTGAGIRVVFQCVVGRPCGVRVRTAVNFPQAWG